MQTATEHTTQATTTTATKQRNAGQYVVLYTDSSGSLSYETKNSKAEVVDFLNEIGQQNVVQAFSGAKAVSLKSKVTF